MQALIEHELIWKVTGAYRLGAKYRSNEGRLLYIKGIGWFIRIRDEFNSLSGLTASHGIAGPFTSQDQAFAYLRNAIRREPAASSPASTTHPNSPV